MRDFSIDLIWAKVQIAITAMGGWLGYFLGGTDGLLFALVVFTALDYVTGIILTSETDHQSEHPILGRSYIFGYGMQSQSHQSM